MSLHETFRSAHDPEAKPNTGELGGLRGDPDASELSGTITLHDIDNARLRLRRGAEDEILKGQISGTVSGLILTGSAVAIRETELAKTADERKAEQARYIELLLEQIE
ncbi:hypothetical protein T8K17_25245 [Thalassobaculum sp. OXR-137]|uniref:hypothetical protein n=1 Tax=Thalassobaculum sp. OXR-137 TaxID=3100173 RepID=UPI002AC8C100|nr:hypothetical protein [Thalassobaculum sp. OXR-137]WPZ34517.1 hypothetical protein T8K17_25245 [Thalassobaculum sp. OXR-137]